MKKIYGAEVWLFSILLPTRHRMALFFGCVTIANVFFKGYI